MSIKTTLTKKEKQKFLKSGTTGKDFDKIDGVIRKFVNLSELDVNNIPEVSLNTDKVINEMKTLDSRYEVFGPMDYIMNNKRFSDIYNRIETKARNK